MTDFEVPQPIISSPYDEPTEHWHIEEGRPPERRSGRREAGYFYRDPHAPATDDGHAARGEWEPLALVNLVRNRLAEWRADGTYPGASRTTLELLNYWRREGRQHRLFFAQLEAAETVIFLKEARADFRQGIDDSPRRTERRPQGRWVRRLSALACKMATGAGKTTVMGMLAAWSILNKVNDRSDARFSDVVLVVCPNVTIRNRLAELDPANGEASLYRTRGPGATASDGRPDQGARAGDQLARVRAARRTDRRVERKVVKAGVPVRIKETITIGTKTTTARGQALPDAEGVRAAGRRRACSRCSRSIATSKGTSRRLRSSR